MSDTVHDAVVIGGGPAGSCAATLLARAGRRVVVLEKDFFPRFHIGESLLPYNHEIFEELGLLPSLESAGFCRKLGAQFHLGTGAKGTGFVFASGAFTRHTQAYQVERARFDELLLRHAQSSGATVHEGVTVERFEPGPASVRVDTLARDGTRASHAARFLIDASGRGNLTGNQEGLRVPNPKLRKLAIYSHFSGVALDPDSRGGDTVIVRLANKWFWLIPLDRTPGREKVSVGLVMDRDEFAAGKRTPAEVFHHWVDACPPMVARLKSAQAAIPFEVTADFSYRNRSFYGPRLVRVGDAAGFIDPIFSSGVFLAMFSARLAARGVLDALQNGGDGTHTFAAYQQRVERAMDLYAEMVDGFYTTPFMELFLEPRAKWNLAAAINAILAGELEGGWRLRWRLRLFFLLVWLQARRPLAPRIAFPPTVSP